MRRIILLLAAATLITAGGRVTTSTATASYNCVGPPADYIAAFDTVRGQPQDGQVTYPYKTVFLEYQGQLTPSSSPTVGNTSEHIHEGACIPEGQTLDAVNAPAGSRFFDARYIAHNVLNYTVASAAASMVTQNGSENLFTATAAQVAELNAAFQASANNGTDTVFQSYPMAIGTSNGIKELRWQTQVDRSNSSALVDQWKVSGRAYFSQNYPGLPTAAAFGAPDCHIDFVRTQNWIVYHDEAGLVKTSYGYTGFGDSQLNPDCSYPAAFTPDALAVTKTTDWPTIIRTTDGTNKLNVIVDPNNHVTPETFAWKQDLGDPADSGTLVQGGYNNPVTVPLSTLGLSGGVHRFMVMGHKWPAPPQIKPISTSIVVMPFAWGDTQAPTTPTSVVISAPQPSSVTVSWTASTDNQAVAGYRVYRDGAQVAGTSATTAPVAGLSAATHLIEIEAYDAAGNTSPRAAITVTRSWVTP